jgi:hypothetical protein
VGYLPRRPRTPLSDAPLALPPKRANLTVPMEGQ